MAKCNKDGEVVRDETTQKMVYKNLMVDFEGLVYSQCSGLETIGAAKNIYVEDYADSNKTRVYIGNPITNKPTTIKLVLFFTGEKRSKVRNDFNEFIRHGYTKYWDDARKRLLHFYVSKELPVGEEKWNGSLPYLKCEYQLENISGYTDVVENNPFIEHT